MSFDPGPLSEVSVLREQHWTLVFVRDLRHPVEKVWSALTDPAQLAEWAPFTADRDLAAVGEAKLAMIDGDDTVDLAGVVTEVDPPALLVYSWGADVLRWELEPTAAGTRLTLRHTAVDRDMLPKMAAGWHLCLVVADRLLAGDPIPPIRGMDALNYGWTELNEAYGDKLGIPATALPE